MSTLMEQTSEKETKQLHNNHNDEEIEIDLMDLLRKVIGIRKKIYKAAGIGLIIGIIVAISIPKQYTVEVTLSPEMGNNKGGGLSGLAASLFRKWSFYGRWNRCLECFLICRYRLFYSLFVGTF